MAPKAFQRYRQIVLSHLVPGPRHHKLGRLRPLHIQAFLAADARTRQDGKPGSLSLRTMLHHYRIPHQALGCAVRWQLIPRNPCDAVEPPRPGLTEMQALDEDQTTRLLEAAKGTTLHLPILLAVTTGARRGELLVR